MCDGISITANRGQWQTVDLLKGGCGMINTIMQEYIKSQMQKHAIKRGQIPGLLGYTNSAKGLRRFDALLAGKLEDKQFIESMRKSTYFGGPKFEKALQAVAHKQSIDRQEYQLTRELRFRKQFRPHGWIETDLKGGREPRGMICMAIPKTKHIHLPDELFERKKGNILTKVRKYFIKLIEDSESKVNQCTIFGEPVRILFRDRFDHCHVFDIRSREFVSTKYVDWRNDEIKCLYY